MSLSVPEGLQFDARGLVPVVVQDYASGDVLMVAWANADALDLTARTGLAHFWSRTPRVIAQRGHDRPEGSYTARLMAKGLDGALKKVGEEATEVVLAAKGESDQRLAEECADLLYHVLVVLEQRHVRPSAVLDVLRERRRSAR